MSAEKSQNLLIDFSSPVVKEHYKPLIPTPCVKDKIIVSPTNSNPFDIVATQTEWPFSQNDPFEFVFRTACQDKCKIIVDSPKCKKLNHTGHIFANEQNNSLDINFKKDLKKRRSLSPSDLFENRNRLDITLDGSENDISKISIGDCSSIKLDDSDIITETKCGLSGLPAKNNLETTQSETDNKSQGLGDYSSEEGLKAAIATRVNKCIEKVLNNTDTTRKLYKSTADLNESRMVSGNKIEQKHYRRSLSASVIKKEFLQNYNNKSFSGGIFVLNNEEKLIPPHTSTQSKTSSSMYSSQASDCLNRGFFANRLSSDERVNSPVVNEIDVSDDSVFFPKDEQIFIEAKKLASTFSETANNSPRHSPGSQNEDENDLMSCEPAFLYADSSEDEAELLRKDPALNIHSRTSKLSLSQSLTNDTKTKLDSEALSRFKNIRCKDLSSEETEKSSKLPKDNLLRRSHSWDTPMPRATPQPRLHIPVPVGVMNSEESLGIKQLRVKKVTGELTKRGPLKAIVPLQNMTRPLEHKEDHLQAQEISPEHNKPSRLVAVTPIRKNNKINHPMAASTPNRSHTSINLKAQVSPITSGINNQRHSMDSRNHNAIPMNASMKRSTSANSSLSSRIITKAQGLTPLLKVTGIKGLNNSKLNNMKSLEKKKAVLQPKLGGPNPRALGDLTKSPLPKPAATKGSGKFLSKLKTGMGMNPIVKDKENREPV